MEQWAVQQVERARGAALNWEQACQGDEFSLLDCLLNAGHCEVPAHYEYCRDALSCELTRQRHGPLGELADRLGVPWPTFWPWMFDTRTMPSPVRSRLADILACPVEPLLLQDWDRVRVEAERAQFLRPDLGWTHALLGYAAERAGDFPTALAQYQAGLGTLGRGAELNAFVCGNFAAQRLHGLRAHWPADLVRHEYLQAALGRDGTGNRPGDLRAYWMGVAGKAESSGDYARAYQSYYAAGWDQLVYDDMDQVLQGLVRTAEGAGFRALHRIAQLHLNYLEESTRNITQPRVKPSLRSRIGGLLRRLLE